MTKTLRDLLAHAETWPREDQDELAEYAMRLLIVEDEKQLAESVRDYLRRERQYVAHAVNELAEYAREIEARRTGVYRMSDDERAAVSQGMAEADQGKFVSDDLLAKADKRDDVQIAPPRRGA